ncbi:unnamed protein product [Pseudo-nitzschia multistriata]|uniref:Uncharacterized protein n=1 Tax=Pseudo-nitzschia multistriata TaxID=183589 RepID=A0A448ZG71_9STRA|nr:unnamed protein product [Pseudo-nitzschia multistriata]
MKRHLIPQCQRLGDNQYMNNKFAILGQCQPLVNERNGRENAKRQKLSKSHNEESLHPTVTPLPTKPDNEHRMVALLSSAMLVFSNEQEEEGRPKEDAQDEEQSDGTTSQSSYDSLTQDQDKKTGARPAASTAPLAITSSTRKKRSVSFNENDIYKSYQMKPISPSTNNCDIISYEDIATNGSLDRHHGHYLPPAPRLPTPTEIFPLIAPLSNQSINKNDCSSYMTTRIYGAK